VTVSPNSGEKGNRTLFAVSYFGLLHLKRAGKCQNSLSAGGKKGVNIEEKKKGKVFVLLYPVR